MSDSDDSAVSTFDLEDEPNQQAPHFQCATNAEQEQRDKAENNAIQQKGAAARRAAKEVALCEWRMQQEEQAHKSMPCTKVGPRILNFQLCRLKYCLMSLHRL